MNPPTAADMMDRSERTLSPDLEIGAAMRELLRTKLTGAPVVDAEGRMCGILTEKDCLRAILGQAMDGMPGTTVRECMTKQVDTVSPTTQLLDITRLFLNRPYRKLPVVDAEGRVLGQVSRRDIMRAIDSAKDNPFLYGHKDQGSQEVSGVHSAIRRALGKS